MRLDLRRRFKLGSSSHVARSTLFSNPGTGLRWVPFVSRSIANLCALQTIPGWSTEGVCRDVFLGCGIMTCRHHLWACIGIIYDRAGSKMFQAARCHAGRQTAVACRAGGTIGRFAVGHEADPPAWMDVKSMRRSPTLEPPLTASSRPPALVALAVGGWCGVFGRPADCNWREREPASGETSPGHPKMESPPSG